MGRATFSTEMSRTRTILECKRQHSRGFPSVLRDFPRCKYGSPSSQGPKNPDLGMRCARNHLNRFGSRWGRRHVLAQMVCATWHRCCAQLGTDVVRSLAHMLCATWKNNLDLKSVGVKKTCERLRVATKHLGAFCDCHRSIALLSPPDTTAAARRDRSKTHLS